MVKNVVFPKILFNVKKESTQFGLAVRLNLHALVTRAILEAGLDSRIANSLVLILWEAGSPRAVFIAFLWGQCPQMKVSRLERNSCNCYHGTFLRGM